MAGAGIESGKAWSRIGAEVAPTDSAAPGVWGDLNEIAENVGAGNWPAPAASAYEYISGFTADGSTGTFSFTSLPQTYKTLRIVIQARDTATQFRPNIRINGDTTSNYRVAYQIGEGASYSTYVASGISSVALNPIPPNDHPYTMTVDFPGYTSANMVSPVLVWWGESNQASGAGNGPITVESGGLFNGSAAITQIDVVQANSNDLGASSTVSLFGLAA